jgi:uncharacterized protein
MPDPMTVEWAARSALLGGVGLLALALAAARRPAWVVAHPALVLVALGVLSALAAAVLVDPHGPALRLTLDPSTEPLLPAGDPARPIYERAVREFGDDGLYAIAMESEDAFAPRNLDTLEAVHREIARLPGVRSVQSLADTVTFRYEPERDWIDVGRLFDAVPRTPDAVEAVRRRALADPLIVGTLVSPDSRAAGISVRFRAMTDRVFIESGLDARIEAILRTAERPGVRFHVAGRPHAKAQVYRGMVRDLRVLVPLAVATLALVLSLATGTRRGVVLPLGIVLIATLWTLALLAWLGRPLTILSTLLAPVLLAIGSVYGVHVLARYDEERARCVERREVARRTLEHVRLPVAIAATTTQIGFAALLASEVPAVIELGAFAVFGVACVALLSLSALPAALALLPPHREVSALPARLAVWSERFVVALDRMLSAVSELTVRRSGACIAVAVAISAVCAAAIPRIEVDTDYLSFFDADSPVRVDFAAMNRLLAGAVPLYVVLSADGPGSFREPAAQRALEALEARVARLPSVSRTYSMADLLRVLNRAVERDDPGEERIPDSRAGVTELIQLAPKDEMGRFANANQSRANLIVRTGEVGSAAIRQLTHGIRGAARQALPEPMRAEVTGNAILLARSADGIARSQPRSVGIAAVAIFALMSAALRSLRLGAIAMIPNLLPVAVYFGMLGLGAAPLSLPTSLIGAMALGIAVDDTAHYLVRYCRERAAGLSADEAARRTSAAVGRPIAVTSIVLAAGFGVILLSDFATLRQFGLLSAATILICMAADLALLPALLVRTKV